MKSKFSDKWKSRSFRAGGYSMLSTLLVLAIVIVANVVAAALPKPMTQIDTTSNGLYSLSEQTERVLDKLQSDIDIYWIVRDSKEKEEVQFLLDRYEATSEYIHVTKVDPIVQPTFVKNYTAESFKENSLIVERGDRFKIVSYDDIFTFDVSKYYVDGSVTQQFNGENALTGAIQYVNHNVLPKVYLLVGHGELELSADFARVLSSANMETAQLTLLTEGKVPDDADAVLVNTPKTDLTEEERNMLMVYLQKGGSLMLITDPFKTDTMPYLQSMMDDYGMIPVNGTVVEGDQSYFAFSAPYQLLPDLGEHSVTQPLIDEGYNVLLPVAQGLQLADPTRETIEVAELLKTSDKAFSQVDDTLETYEKRPDDIDGPFALAAAATETFDNGETANIVWVTSSYFVDDAVNARASGANMDLFANAMGWICEQGEESITIRAKTYQLEYLTMSATTSTVLSILFIAVIPLAFVGIGVFMWVRRKRR